jgi:hypothetical protein
MQTSQVGCNRATMQRGTASGPRAIVVSWGLCVRVKRNAINRELSTPQASGAGNRDTLALAANTTLSRFAPVCQNQVGSGMLAFWQTAVNLRTEDKEPKAVAASAPFANRFRKWQIGSRLAGAVYLLKRGGKEHVVAWLPAP